MNELKCGTVSPRGRGGVCAAAGTCCWLQVTCCTSLACLVIKRIIISCGIQPKKENHTHSHCPAYTSLSLPAHPAALPPAALLHAFLRETRTSCDALQTKRIFARPKGCDDVALGHGLQLRPVRSTHSPLPVLPVLQPAGQQALVVY